MREQLLEERMARRAVEAVSKLQRELYEKMAKMELSIESKKLISLDDN